MFPRSKWALSALPATGRSQTNGEMSSWKRVLLTGNSSELMHRAAAAPLPTRAVPPGEPSLQEPLDTLGRCRQPPSAGNKGRF